MKIFKRIVKILLTLLILAAVAYGGYRLWQSRSATEAAAPAVQYTRVTVGTGSLTKSVTGTGSLAINKTSAVTVDFPVVVTETLVREGELVRVGDPIARVDADALKTAITTLNAELAELDSSIASLAASYTGTSTIKPSASGRVKQIYVTEGDMTNTVMDEYGGLMLLSGDGNMRVTLAAELALNATVRVKSGNTTYTGTVSAVHDDGTVTVLFPDNTTLPGEAVTVLTGTTPVGEGRAEINMPVTVSSTVDGYVAKVYTRVNAKVTRRTSLVYVTHIPADTEYDQQVRQRTEKLAALDAARQALISGYVTSDVDGIVASFEPASATELVAGTSLATIYVGNAMQMTISVDELDITSVRVGQRVSVAMDAVPGKTYDATVSYISQIGTPSSGVTNYAVTLDVASDDVLKIGMNGTATIVVEEVTDVVLVPLTAVSTGRGGSYVWVADDTAEGGVPGRQVYIETGLSNEDYAEVKSGLSAGDVVLVTRTASTGSDTTQGGFGMQMPGGMQMPSEMQMPGGTQQNRQNNTNRQTTRPSAR